LRTRRNVRDFEIQGEIRAEAEKYLVVIAPWLGSGTPFYSLAFSMLIARKGHKVSFVIDDSRFGTNVFRHYFLMVCIRMVFGLVGRRFEVTYLSSTKPEKPLDAAANSIIARLADLNTVWTLRGEMIESRRAELINLFTAQYGRAYSAISEIMRNGRFDVLFVPGGMYGNSGLWVACARAAAMRIVSYDGGASGVAMLAVTGVACQLQDIPLAHAVLKERCLANPAEHDYVLKTAHTEMDLRRSGTDKFSSQKSGSSGSCRQYEGAMMIALNSSWDGAALGLHSVFKTSMEWVVETVRFLLDHTDNLIVIRQHPAERLEAARSTDDYAKLLSSNFGADPRIRFIAAEEDVNSYDLLDSVAAVIVYTSTLGVEATALGKPVITESNSYYSGLGFVWGCRSLQDYHSALLQAARGGLTVTAEMKRDAYYCYYLTQCRNWAFTPYTPMEISRYRVSFDEMYRDPAVAVMVQAAEEGRPLSLLNHLVAAKMAGQEIA
jgi:hypothetical protein